MSKIFLSFSFSIVSLIIGICVGYFLTPSYQNSMYQKTEMSLGTADRWLDLRYLNAMISHHRGAILMAEQASRNSQREEVKKLANEILTEEPKLITKLYDLKKELYKDSKVVRDPQAVQLGPADSNFDLRFLNGLIFHHEEGIAMTTELRSKTSTAQILDDANGVEDFLRKTLVPLKELRKEWYGI